MRISTLRKANKQGFTLVELMIVVAIVGVLAVLAIFGVRKYLANAKTAEARNSLGAISKDASMAYDRESTNNTIIAAGSAGSAAQKSLCNSAAAMVPAAITSVQNKKYQSSAADWNAGNSSTGWNCLKFTMEQPQYFMYAYAATNVTNALTGTFTATAYGDLDGNGTSSTFQVLGAMQSGQVAVSPNISESNPEE